MLVVVVGHTHPSNLLCLGRDYVVISGLGLLAATHTHNVPWAAAADTFRSLQAILETVLSVRVLGGLHHLVGMTAIGCVCRHSHL